MTWASPWKRLIDSGRHFTDERTARARGLVSRLIAQGEHTTSEVSVVVAGLIGRTRRRGDDLEAAGRAVVARPRDALQEATTDVLSAVSRRLFGGPSRERSRGSGDSAGLSSETGSDRGTPTEPAAIEPPHPVVTRDLDVDARHEFMAATRAAIVAAATTAQEVDLDCTAVACVALVDDSVIAMLVALAFTAKRHGVRVALVHAPRPMRGQFEAAGVAQLFDWKR